MLLNKVHEIHYSYPFFEEYLKIYRKYVFKEYTCKINASTLLLPARLAAISDQRLELESTISSALL